MEASLENTYKEFRRLGVIEKTERDADAVLSGLVARPGRIRHRGGANRVAGMGLPGLWLVL